MIKEISIACLIRKKDLNQIKKQLGFTGLLVFVLCFHL